MFLHIYMDKLRNRSIPLRCKNALQRCCWITFFFPIQFRRVVPVPTGGRLLEWRQYSRSKFRTLFADVIVADVEVTWSRVGADCGWRHSRVGQRHIGTLAGACVQHSLCPPTAPASNRECLVSTFKQHSSFWLTDAHIIFIRLYFF